MTDPWARPTGNHRVVDIELTSGEPPPALITFDVYVTSQPALALVASRFEADGAVYLLQQFFDRRPANVLLELPPADAIVDGQVTGAPAPATTAPATVPDATLAVPATTTYVVGTAP